LHAMQALSQLSYSPRRSVVKRPSAAFFITPLIRIFKIK